MDAVTLALAKNHTKKHTGEQVIQKATNSPVEEISFDGGIYSVGNNVVNGQISVTLKGNTKTNIGEDSWATALDGWVSDYDSIVSNKYRLTHTSDATGERDISAKIDLTKYYLITAYGISASDTDGAKFDIINGSGGASIKTSSTLTKTQSQRIGLILQPSDLTGTTPYLQMTAKGSGYAEFYQFFIQEISAAEYAEGLDVLMARYHYRTRGVKSTNSVRVKSVGKNLFDGNFKTYGSLSWRSDYCPCKPLTTYTAKILAGSTGGTYRRGFFKFYDKNKNIISETTLTSSNPNTETTPADCFYLIRYWEWNTSAPVVSEVSSLEAQIELGSTATEYEPYKESSVIINLPEPLRSVPSANDEVSVTEGIKTQRVKPYALQTSDIDSIRLTSVNLDYILVKKPVDSYMYGKTANVVGTASLEGYTEVPTGVEVDDAKYIGQVIFWATANYYWVGAAKGTTIEQARAALVGKSLTYQLATPIVTKLPAQAPLQVFENGTVYVEPIGDASESTLPSVEMTIPTGTSNKFGVATHNYGGAAADWVLTNSESKCFLLAVSNAGGAANIIAPNRPGTMYAISNASGYAIKIKKSGGNGVEVVDSKTVLVIHNGTDYTALTAEL